MGILLLKKLNCKILAGEFKKLRDGNDGMLREKLIDYFRAGAKPHDEFTIGAEFEHLLVEKGTLQWVPFFGEKGVESLLKELLTKGWQGDYEGEYLIGLHNENATITLEPGCQLELSVRHTDSLKKINKVYLDFLRDIFPILEERNQVMLNIGYHPVSKISEIEFNPKIRYKYMSEYLKEQGQYAHNMMKGTASTQVTVDYAHQDDFRKKFQVIYVLSPLISALFDNSPIFEGKPYQGHCLRRLIWDNCDDQRCVIDDILKSDFGFADYAEFILNTPPIFIKENQEYIYTGAKTVREIYAEKELTIDALEHVLAMVFPDIRLKNFIEIRMADALPYPLNMAYVALWKGLLYSQDNLDALYEFVLTIKPEEVEKAKEDILKEGIQAKIGDNPLLELAKDLFFMANKELNFFEAPYLQPLEPIIFKKLTPKEVMVKYLNEFN